jgi:hypothetical protein
MYKKGKGLNYKTLIAFLGKNQMKGWTTPKSEWISINTDGVWNENFPIESLRGTGTRISGHSSEYSEFFEKFYGCWPWASSGLHKIDRYNMSPADSDTYPQYYNPSTKSIMFIQKHIIDDGDKDRIFEFIEKYDSKMITGIGYDWNKDIK